MGDADVTGRPPYREISTRFGTWGLFPGIRRLPCDPGLISHGPVGAKRMGIWRYDVRRPPEDERSPASESSLRATP